MNFRVRHKNCGGEVVKRTCQKCSKHWSIIQHFSTLDYYSEKIDSLKAKKGTTGNPVTDALPNWPRWARLTSTATVFGIIGCIVYYFI